MPTLTLAREGFSIQIDSPESGDVEWLDENLTPGFQSVVDPSPQRRVVKTVDAQRYQALMSCGAVSPDDRVRCFAVDAPGGTCRRWNAPQPTLYDAEFDVCYVSREDGRLVDVVAPASRPSTRIALLRVVREFTAHHLVARGTLQLHAAGFAHGGRGVLVVGAKRAGKTSVLVHGLGEADSQFITNDRALVSLDGDGAWRLGGMPTVVAIRPDSAALLNRPDLAAAGRWRARMTLAEAHSAGDDGPGRAARDPLGLSPRQFCVRLGVGCVASAPLRVLVFPRIAHRGSGITFLRLPPAVAGERLAAHRLNPAGTMFLADAPTTTLPGPEAMLARLQASIPALECVLGQEAYVTRTMNDAIFSALHPLPDGDTSWTS